MDKSNINGRNTYVIFRKHRSIVASDSLELTSPCSEVAGNPAGRTSRRPPSHQLSCTQKLIVRHLGCKVALRLPICRGPILFVNQF